MCEASWMRSAQLGSWHMGLKTQRRCPHTHTRLVLAAAKTLIESVNLSSSYYAFSPLLSLFEMDRVVQPLELLRWTGF